MRAPEISTLPRGRSWPGRAVAGSGFAAAAPAVLTRRKPQPVPEKAPGEDADEDDDEDDDDDELEGEAGDEEIGPDCDARTSVSRKVVCDWRNDA